VREGAAIASKYLRPAFGCRCLRDLTPSTLEDYFAALDVSYPILSKIRDSLSSQVLRRTFATNAQGYGTPKDVQTHLRRTDIATTMEVYTVAIPESVRKLVNAVAHDVMTAEPPAIEDPVPLTRRVQ
jgi:integrase